MSKYDKLKRVSKQLRNTNTQQADTNGTTNYSTKKWQAVEEHRRKEERLHDQAIYGRSTRSNSHGIQSGYDRGNQTAIRKHQEKTSKGWSKYRNSGQLSKKKKG